MSADTQAVGSGIGSPPADTSQRLLKLLATDLDAGFTELVRVHQRVVYSALVRACAHPVDAEDLTAQAFLRAYRALRDYDEDRIYRLDPRPWLLTIALNTWRNFARDHSRRPSQVPLECADNLPSAQESVEVLAERGEESRQLVGLVDRLPEPQRLAVVLRHVCQLPVAEIAQVLDCPAGTAKSHIFRGLQRLRLEYATAMQAGGGSR
jgi:RNA polymerase sigma-70 factor (ECF subfamily)